MYPGIFILNPHIPSPHLPLKVMDFGQKNKALINGVSVLKGKPLLDPQNASSLFLCSQAAEW